MSVKSWSPEADARASTVKADGTIVVPPGNFDYLRGVMREHLQHPEWDEVPENALELSREESPEDDGEPGET